VIVYAVVDDALSPDFALGYSLEVFIRREGGERFIEEVRGDEPEAGGEAADRGARARRGRAELVSDTRDAFIEIARHGFWLGRFRVLIDEEIAGKVGRGEVGRFLVEAGPHQVQVTGWTGRWYGSDRIHVDVPPGQVRRLTCWPDPSEPTSGVPRDRRIVLTTRGVEARRRS
jgi:hypothetical protein